MATKQSCMQASWGACDLGWCASRTKLSTDPPIAMTDLACRGNEPNLDSWQKNVANLTGCNKAQSVGVRCFERDYTVRLASTQSPTGAGLTDGRLEVWLNQG